MTSSEISDIEALHEQACNNKEDGYIDPVTGYWVFSRFFHEKRGKCCGNLCRHCPYEHVNVKPSRLEKEKLKKDQNWIYYITKRSILDFQLSFV